MILFTILFATSVDASTMTADSSATLKSRDGESAREYFIKKKTMQNILERRNSVLVDHVDSFIQGSMEYDLDPYLLVSISGLESSFAKAMIPGTYNAYGWGSGKIHFESWNDGIMTISRSLRENYYNKGADSVADVGRKYAASKTWSVRVESFMRQFYAEEMRVRYMAQLL